MDHGNHGEGPPKPKNKFLGLLAEIWVGTKEEVGGSTYGVAAYADMNNLMMAKSPSQLRH